MGGCHTYGHSPMGRLIRYRLTNILSFRGLTEGAILDHNRICQTSVEKHELKYVVFDVEVMKTSIDSKYITTQGREYPDQNGAFDSMRRVHPLAELRYLQSPTYSGSRNAVYTPPASFPRIIHCQHIELHWPVRLTNGPPYIGGIRGA
jgi:hypothetical protein